MSNLFMTRWFRRCVAVFLMTCMPILASCSEVDKWKSKMKFYQFDKVNPWTLNGSAYEIDRSRWGTEFVDYYGQSWFEFSDGTKSYFLPSHSVWSGGNTAMGGYGDKVPERVHMWYFDKQEQRSYLLDTELPQEKIYQMFQQKLPTYYGFYGYQEKQFNKLVLGVAPRGNIILWMSSDAPRQVEVANFVAKVQEPPQDVILTTAEREMGLTLVDNDPEGSRQELARVNHSFSLDSSQLEPETIQKLRSGWLPSPDWYMDARISYPWRFKISTNIKSSPEFEAIYINGERRMVFAPEVRATENQAQPIPERMNVYVYDQSGKFKQVWIEFYTDNIFTQTPDTTEIRKAFKTLYPNRTVADNDRSVGADEFTTLELNFSDDLTNLDMFLVKGNERIPLNKGNYKVFDQLPFAYDKNAKGN